MGHVSDESPKEPHPLTLLHEYLETRAGKRGGTRMSLERTLEQMKARHSVSQDELLDALIDSVHHLPGDQEQLHETVKFWWELRSGVRVLSPRESATLKKTSPLAPPPGLTPSVDDLQDWHARVSTFPKRARSSRAVTKSRSPSPPLRASSDSDSSNLKGAQS
eukprot:3779663-Amphidinium_carterae.1